MVEEVDPILFNWSEDLYFIIINNVESSNFGHEMFEDKL